MSLISNQLLGLNGFDTSQARLGNKNGSDMTETHFKLFEEVAKKSNLRGERSVAEISDKTKALYSELSIDVKQTIKPYLKDRDYELNLFDKTLKEIMNIPIEVEIERHEMKEAIVFARLGIDFLKLKELDVRIDMLTLAEQNVGNSSYLTKSDKNIFSERIKELKAQLEQQKEALITGSNPNELEPLDALKFEQIDEITPLYNQIQESKKYVL
ncbi:hypothetical protein CJF42_05845 [Pseudoalteromonas sp. NBT06-2]|uniref:hypothetical protein n=1 Tax=Pseudoalteromonas sp. NBT06-2 TaxID=2025950 RepID=UPI000BA6AD95|nr:hypothetical protein [Pseudoalteromonas sp. NBT06-2]PAJ75283.1 hypothetical protein CJF42_05845 [Pseudoalteromonas sp. NBT06-2]